MKDIHDRMPVILSKEGCDMWLDPGASAERLASLLIPSVEEFQAVPVDTRVNSPKNDDERCIAAPTTLFPP